MTTLSKWFMCKIWNNMLTSPFVSATFCWFCINGFLFSPLGENNLSVKKKWCNHSSFNNCFLVAYFLLKHCLCSSKTRRKKNLFSCFPIQWFVELGIYFPRLGLKRKPLLLAVQAWIVWAPQGQTWSLKIINTLSAMRATFSFSTKLASRLQIHFLPLVYN